MGNFSFGLEKFNGSGDFWSWKKKLKAVLIQKKVDLAIGDESEIPATMTKFQRKEMSKTTYSILFLHLADNVCRRWEI